MESKKHRTNLRKRVIVSALAGIVGMAAVNVNPIQAEALSEEIEHARYLYTQYCEVSEESIIEVTWSEYSQLLRMTMAESGYCSEDMMNGCASAAVNQCIRNDCTMEETLNRPGAFGNGIHEFRDSEGVWREVKLSDVNNTVIDAANDALKGNDVTSEIGGAIGFFAPNECSEERVKYFYDHISGGQLKQIENVVFFSKWE